MRLRVAGLLACLLAAPASAVTIDWVLVGDPGNAADTATNCFSANCGSVSYEYYISKVIIRDCCSLARCSVW